MKAKEWAKLNGYTHQTVQRWCRSGNMPKGVKVEQSETGYWIITDPKYENLKEENKNQITVGYARVSTGGQKDDLQRQVERIKAFGLSSGIPDIKVYKEIASGMNENRRVLNSILSDPEITNIIVEHRERISRINFKLIESALKAQDRNIIVMDDEEIEDDIIRDITEVMTSFCARFYGRRGAKNKAKKAMKVLTEEE